MAADQIDDAGNIRAIVLIDELDQHLHPALQAAILPHLTELLPNAQFVATTHSPLMALGAQPSDLLVLRRTEDEVVIESRVPDYRCFSAEDMLTDDRLFDAPAYAPETEKRLARYEALVAKGPEERTRAERRELTELAKNMHAQPLPSTIDDKVAAALAAAATGSSWPRRGRTRLSRTRKRTRRTARCTTTTRSTQRWKHCATRSARTASRRRPRRDRGTSNTSGRRAPSANQVRILATTGWRGAILGVIDTLVQRKGLSVRDAVDSVTAGMSTSELPYAGTARAIRRDPASFGLVF